MISSKPKHICTNELACHSGYQIGLVFHEIIPKNDKQKDELMREIQETFLAFVHGLFTLQEQIFVYSCPHK